MSIEPSGQGGRQLVVVDLTFAREAVLADDDRGMAARKLFFQGCDKEGLMLLGV